MERSRFTLYHVLSQIRGNESLKQRIEADLRDGSLSHAYVIEGKRGTGKHTLARTLAAALSCTANKDSLDSLPCMQCEACRKIFADLSPDVITVGREKDKATIGVDAVREIRRGVATVPSELEKKFYIIEEADLMTVQAQNALLLTLEEPPSFVVFFLLAESARALLETIRSRAPSLRMEALRREELKEALLTLDPRARVTLNTQREEFEAILTAADGSLGEAMRLLDPKERKTYLTAHALVESAIDALSGKTGASEMIRILSSFPQKRPEAIAHLQMLRTALRDLILLSKIDDPHLCFFSDTERAKDLAEGFSIAALCRALEATDRAVDALHQNAGMLITMTTLAVALTA